MMPIWPSKTNKPTGEQSPVFYYFSNFIKTILAILWLNHKSCGIFSAAGFLT